MTKSKRPASDNASKRVSKDEASSGNFADAIESIGNVEPLDRSNVVQQAPAGTRGTRTEARTKSSSQDRTIVMGKDKPSGATPSMPGTIPKPRNVAGSKATRTQMRRLRAGKLRPERVVDLHGFSQDQAYRSLCNAIARAVDEGVRCVLIIHGRGVHSQGGRPVLKHALTDWIAQPPLNQHVIGLCAAQSADGGDGASYLLLRS